LIKQELTNLPSKIGSSLAEEQIINEVITLLISITITLYLLAFPLYYLLQNLAYLLGCVIPPQTTTPKGQNDAFHAS
jgi:hypothetical protein